MLGIQSASSKVARTLCEKNSGSTAYLRKSHFSPLFQRASKVATSGWLSTPTFLVVLAQVLPCGVMSIDVSDFGMKYMEPLAAPLELCMLPFMSVATMSTVEAPLALQHSVISSPGQMMETGGSPALSSTLRH